MIRTIYKQQEKKLKIQNTKRSRKYFIIILEWKILDIQTIIDVSLTWVESFQVEALTNLRTVMPCAEIKSHQDKKGQQGTNL